MMDPFKNFNLAASYLKYYYVIDFILYLILFLGAAEVGLKSWKSMKENKASIWIVRVVGAILAIGMIIWETNAGFNLSKLGPLAAIAFIALIVIAIFTLLVDAGQGIGGAGAWAFLILFYTIRAIFPNMWAWLRENANLITGLLYIGVLFAIIYAIKGLFDIFKGKDKEKEELSGYGMEEPTKVLGREAPAQLLQAPAEEISEAAKPKDINKLIKDAIKDLKDTEAAAKDIKQIKDTAEEVKAENLKNIELDKDNYNLILQVIRYLQALPPNSLLSDETKQKILEIIEKVEQNITARDYQELDKRIDVIRRQIDGELNNKIRHILQVESNNITESDIQKIMVANQAHWTTLVRNSREFIDALENAKQQVQTNDQQILGILEEIKRNLSTPIPQLSDITQKFVNITELIRRSHNLRKFIDGTLENFYGLMNTFIQTVTSMHKAIKEGLGQVKETSQKGKRADVLLRELAAKCKTMNFFLEQLRKKGANLEKIDPKIIQMLEKTDIEQISKAHIRYWLEVIWDIFDKAYRQTEHQLDDPSLYVDLRFSKEDVLKIRNTIGDLTNQLRKILEQMQH